MTQPDPADTKTPEELHQQIDELDSQARRIPVPLRTRPATPDPAARAAEAAAEIFSKHLCGVIRGYITAALAGKDAEIERLKKVATKNRDGFEEYERRYYLEVNKTETLQSDLATARAEVEALLAQLRATGHVPYLDRMKELQQRAEAAEAEVERLNKDRDSLIEKTDAMIDALDNDRDKLKAEAHQLREALIASINTMRREAISTSHIAPIISDRLLGGAETAAAALTPKGTPAAGGET